VAIQLIGVQPIVANVGEAAGPQSYCVGEVTADGETVCTAVSCTNDLGVAGNMNLVHWQGEGDSYRIYKAAGGVFGLIGTTDGNYLIDDNKVPETGQQPPAEA
jgi:hypothetical protein